MSLNFALEGSYAWFKLLKRIIYDFLIFLGLIIFFWKAPQFRVEHLELELSPNYLRKYLSARFESVLRSWERESFFKVLLNLRGIEEKFREVGLLESIYIHPVFPNKLKVEVNLKEPAYLVYLKTHTVRKVLLYSSEGKLVVSLPYKTYPELMKLYEELSANDSKPFVVLHIDSSEPEIELIRRYMAVLLEESEKISYEINSECADKCFYLEKLIWLDDKGEFKLIMISSLENFRQKFAVLLGTPLNLDRKLKLLTGFLNCARKLPIKLSKLEYIDISSGRFITVKFREN